MSRYTFGSTGAAAGNALEQFLMQRVAEERQRLLDEENILTDRTNRSLARERETREAAEAAQRAKLNEEALASMQEERASRQLEREATRYKTQADTAGLLYRPGDVVDPTDTQTPAPLRVAQQTVPGRTIPMPGAAAGGVPGVIEAAMAPPGPTGRETFLGTTAQREQEALLADPSLPAAAKAMLRAGVKLTAADFQTTPQTEPEYWVDRQGNVKKLGDFPKGAGFHMAPAPSAASVPTPPAQLDAAAIMFNQGMGFPGRNAQVNMAIAERARELAEQGGQPWSPALTKAYATAQSAALRDLTQMGAAMETFSGMATRNMANLDQVLTTLPDTGVPWLNVPYRAFMDKALGDPRLAQFAAALRPVQTEIARLLENAKLSGVALSVHGQQEIERAMNPNATVGQIRAALNTFRVEIGNRAISQTEGAAGVMDNLRNFPGAPATPTTPQATPTAPRRRRYDSNGNPLPD